MKASYIEVGLTCATIAFALAGACTFPDVDTTAPPGSGGGSTGPASSGSGIVTSSSASASSTTDAIVTSTASTGSSAGGGGSSTTSDGGGGAGGTGTGGEGVGAGTSTVTGVGGGVTDTECDDGCIPFPSEGGGTPGSGELGDCDADGAANVDDCQPCNPEVHPYDPGDDAAFHDEAYEIFGMPGELSFDYDCSGVASFEYEAAADGCGAYDSTSCPDDPIYTTNAAVCGESANVQSCRVSGVAIGVAGSCVNDGTASPMLVRCR